MKGMKISLATLAALCAFAAQAAVNVSPSGMTDGTDAAAINAAIATAAAGDGKVQLADGTYNLTSPVALDVAVELIGNDANRAAVVLDGANASRLIDVTAAGAFVHGVRFERGYSDKTDNYYHGPVYMSAAGVISNCTVKMSKAGKYCGGVGMGAGTIVDCDITGCNTTDSGNASIGGALRLYGATCVADHLVITNNSAKKGSGVYLKTSGAKLLNSLIENNNAGGNDGGGIMSESGTIVSNCVIRGNRGSNGAGICGGGHVYDSLIVGNTATGMGGGIYKSNGTMRGCTVAGNTAGTAPYGVYQSNGAIQDCVIWYNGTTFYLKDEASLMVKGGTCTYTCAALAGNGTGNIAGRTPALVDPASGDYRLSAASPCRAAGIDGIDMGYYRFAAATAPRVAFTSTIVDGKAPATVGVTAVAEGAEATGYAWDFGDGSAVDTTSGTTAQHEYTSAGQYTITLTVSTVGGNLTYAIANAVTLGSSEVWVSETGANRFPYASSEDAAADVLTAVEALALGPGETGKVHVGDGTYTIDSAIALKQPIELIGNDADPSQVKLDGGSARRVIYTKHAEAFVHGVTIQNGKVTGGNDFDGVSAHYAGSAFTAGGVFSNCVFKSMNGQYDTVGISNGGIITDCEIWDGVNNDSNGGGAANGGCVKMNGGVLRRTLVTGGKAVYGGGIRVNGGLVDACVITNCQSTSAGMGGGIYQTAGVVSNCVITSNTKGGSTGGGVYMTGGTMVGCLITGNKRSVGGGVYKTNGTLRNCTVTGNTATTSNGGVCQTGGAIENCIIAYNGINDETDDSLDATGGTVTYTCAWKAPTGNGNIKADPMFVAAAAGDYHISASSHCVDAGTNAAWGADGTDLEGNERVLDGNDDGIAQVDMGCYEFDPAKAPPSCAFEVISGGSGQSVPHSAVLKASAAGAVGTVNGYVWDFGDGTIVTSQTDTVSHEYTVFGDYTVVLSLDCTAGGVKSFEKASAVSLKSAFVYVSNDGSNTAPYDRPEKAAHDLADAVAAVAIPENGKGLVHVAAGVYPREKAEPIIITRAIRVVGDAGAEVTRIYGNKKAALLLQLAHADAEVEGLTFDNSGSSARVAYLQTGTASNCVFTGGNLNQTGGVYMDGGLVAHCVISNSVSYDSGYGNSYANGGFYVAGGMMRDCVVTNCTGSCQSAGTVEGGTVSNCVIVGNAASSRGTVRLISGVLANCDIRGNGTKSQTTSGTGVYVRGGIFRNCLIAANTAPGGWAGVKAVSEAYGDAPVIENCTIVTNVGASAGVVTSVDSAVWYNCLFAGNAGTEDRGAAIYTACADLTMAAARFRNPVRGDYRPLRSSPAVNAGVERPWMAGAVDLFGNPRVKGGAPDIGCYENPLSGLFLIVK